MPDASSIAAQIDAHKGEQTGSFRFWDVLPVRPNDWLWRIVGAKASGNQLDIILVDGMGDDALDPKTGVALSVWDPDGYSKTKDGFTVAKASRVKFGGCDVRLSGTELHIEFDGANKRAVSSDQALTVDTGP